MKLTAQELIENLIVYKITNEVNGKLYFGITKVGIKKRWNQHKCNSTRKTYHLYNAIIKYGFENFKIDIIKLCDTDLEMYQLEKQLIEKYNTNNPLYGYNNSTGGEFSAKGSTRTEAQRKKISDYQKTRIRKPHSKETKLKMSIIAKGRDMSKAILASAQNKKGSPAHNIVSVYSIDDNYEVIEYKSIKEASNKTGILSTSICNNLKNKSKKAGGLKWNYQQTN